MYQTPMLECYGTFEDLTAGGNGNSAKRLGVNDLATVLNAQSNGASDNVGCNPRAQPFSHAGCMS